MLISPSNKASGLLPLPAMRRLTCAAADSVTSSHVGKGHSHQLESSRLQIPESAPESGIPRYDVFEYAMNGRHRVASTQRVGSAM